MKRYKYILYLCIGVATLLACVHFLPRRDVRIGGIGLGYCSFSRGGYSEAEKILIPALNSMSGYKRMLGVDNFNFLYTQNDVPVLVTALSDPCYLVRESAITKIADKPLMDILLKVYKEDKTERVFILSAVAASPGIKYIRNNAEFSNEVLKAAQGNEPDLRKLGLMLIPRLEIAQGQSLLLDAMTDPSTEIRQTVADDVFSLARYGDENVVKRLRRIFGESSDPMIKSNIRKAFDDIVAGRFPLIALENDPAPIAAVAVNTQKVPLQDLSYPVEGSSTTVLFNLPVGSKTKGYIEFHYTRELSSVTPELMSKLEDELMPYTQKGDRYLIGIGGERWITGTLTGFRAVSPACGGVVVGVLSIDSPENQKLLAEISSRELFVKKDTEGIGENVLTKSEIGMFIKTPVSGAETKAVKAFLKEYIGNAYGDWRTKRYEEGMSHNDFNELQKLANYDVKVKYDLLPVNLGKGSTGFIVSVGWGNGNDCYASMFGYLEKNDDGFRLIKIRDERISPDETGEGERAPFGDYSVIGTVSNVLDYNQDGYGDLIISTSGYESYGYTLLEFDGIIFKKTNISCGYGC